MWLHIYSVSPGFFTRNPRNQEPRARRFREQSRHPANALIAFLVLENRPEEGGNTPIYSLINTFTEHLLCVRLCARHWGYERIPTFPELKLLTGDKGSILVFGLFVRINQNENAF